MSHVESCAKWNSMKHGSGTGCWEKKLRTRLSTTWCEQTPFGSEISGQSCPLRIWIILSQAASDHTRPRGVCLELPVAKFTLAQLPDSRWTDTPEVSPPGFGSPDFTTPGIIDRSMAISQNWKKPAYPSCSTTRLSSPVLTCCSELGKPPEGRADGLGNRCFPSSRWHFGWVGEGYPTKGRPKVDGMTGRYSCDRTPLPRQPQNVEPDDPEPARSHHHSSLHMCVLIEIQ